MWAYDKADAYSLFYDGAVRKAVAFLDEYNTAHADIVLASSRELEVLAKRQGATQTSIVDNGIYLDDFAPRAKRDKMLAVYVGNLVQDMWGVDMLLEAVPFVAREFTSFHVAVIGEGPLRAKYESICRRLGVDKRVRFHGYMPHGKIGDVICAACVAVAPYKPFPAFRFSSSLKILEYLAAGTPVVVSKVGPFADMINSQQLGVVVDATAEKIAEGITSILRLSNDEWKAMSLRALSSAREYEWHNIMPKALDQIEKIWASKHTLPSESKQRSF